MFFVIRAVSAVELLCHCQFDSNLLNIVLFYFAALFVDAMIINRL